MLVIIIIGHKIIWIRSGCNIARYIPQIVYMTNIVPLAIMADINYLIKSDAHMSKKIPIIMTKSDFPTLIMVPSISVSIWQKEVEKTIFPRVLHLQTAYRNMTILKLVRIEGLKFLKWESCTTISFFRCLDWRNKERWYKRETVIRINFLIVLVLKWNESYRMI